MAASTWDDFDDTTAGFEFSALPDGNFEALIIRRTDGHFAGKDDNPAGRTLNITYEITKPPAAEGSEPDPELIGEQFSDKKWLNRPEAKETLMKELKRLGFNIESWGKVDSDFPRATMVPLALKYLTLTKIPVKLAKKTTTKGNRSFANLYINGRVKYEGDPDIVPNELVMAVADEPESAAELF
jgi:hypothetical protein